MPSLTDGAIRQAIKRVEIAGKQESLTEGEGRGTGRLVLVLKSMPRRVTAEWMAQQWRDGKRAKAKLGDYPSMSLAQAREVFKRDYADMATKPNFIQGHLPVARSVASGENIATFDASSSVWPFKREGKLEIVWSPVDETPVFTLTGGIFKDAPHPNAAKLYLT